MTKKIAIAFTLLLAGQVFVTAQPKFNQPFGTEKDYKRLWYLNSQYIQSWLRSDTATYDKLLWAEDFVQQSGSDGQLYSKKEMMCLFGKKRFDEIVYFYADNTRIKFVTDNVAMIISNPPYLGKDEQDESLTWYNDVYVKRDGNWVCVSANITAVINAEAPLPLLKAIPPPPNFVTLYPITNDEANILTERHNMVKQMFEMGYDKMEDKLLDSQFVMITEKGGLVSKQELQSYFKKAKSKVLLPYAVHNLYIRLVAADVAMVHGLIIYNAATSEITGKQFNDIYVKRGNEWKCVAANNTPAK